MEKFSNNNGGEEPKKRSLMDRILGRNKTPEIDLSKKRREDEERVRIESFQSRFDVSAEKSTPPRPDLRKPTPHNPDSKIDQKNKAPEIKYRCKFCKQEFTGKHLCKAIEERGYNQPVQPSEDTSSFFTSFIVGELTDSTLMGYAAGRNLAGAMLGSSLHSRHQGEFSGQGGDFGGSGATGRFEVDNNKSANVTSATINDSTPLETNSAPVIVDESTSPSTHSFEESSNKY